MKPVSEEGSEQVADGDPHHVEERGDEEQGERELVADQQTIEELVVVATNRIIYIRTTSIEGYQTVLKK